MENVINLISFVFETIIFDTFFKEVLQRKKVNKIIFLVFYFISIAFVFSINNYDNSKLNLLINLLVYLIILLILFEGNLKEKVFYYITFYTAFAGIEIICEFLLVFFLGSRYNWSAQIGVPRLAITCLEKLTTFILLFFLKKKINKEESIVQNRLFLYSFILPIATFWVYGGLFYSGLMLKISTQNEIIFVIACILLLFSNVIIFLIYDYTFLLNKEKQYLELSSLKLDMEKKYYERLEKVNLQQNHYMHDFKLLIKTIGALAAKDQNDEISSVI